MKEIIVYGYRAHYIGQTVTGCEVSDDNGVFRLAHAWIDHQDESPVIAVGSAYLDPSKCRLMTAKDRDRYLAILEQIRGLREELKKLEVESLIRGDPVSWEWMKQHQRPEIKTPEPFRAKVEITKLRRGSKVIISTTLSSWHRWVGTVGRLRRFNAKTALIETKDKRQIAVPYAYLKPYSPETRAKAKLDKRHAEMGAKVVGQLNRIIR